MPLLKVGEKFDFSIIPYDYIGNLTTRENTKDKFSFEVIEVGKYGLYNIEIIYDGEAIGNIVLNQKPLDELILSKKKEGNDG